ncbi:MAG: hypothetical protein LIO85_00320 [Rikenellaceae bacterium]|nr:hypothetical protein [Rikenellaceae bacterium]
MYLKTINTLLAVAPLFLVSCILSGNGGSTGTVSAEKVATQTVPSSATEVREQPAVETAGSGPEEAGSVPEALFETEDSPRDLPDDSLSEEIENIAAILAQYPELADYVPHVPDYGDGVFHVSGNFFGERDDDIAVLVRTVDTGRVRLLFINKGNHYGRMFVFFEEDNPGGDDYYWVGEMRAVPAGEPLWSNYTDDFRAFEDVPEDEIVYLPYDAVYVHVAEACGGGFVYWDDGVFRWLQQE